MNVKLKNFAILPSPLTNDADMAKNWKRWKDSFLIYLSASGWVNKMNCDKVKLLKSTVGPLGIDALNSIQSTNAGNDIPVEDLLDMLTLYFDAPEKETVRRYKFFSRQKEDNETFEMYVNDLKEKAKICNFGSLKDTLIRDKLILDIKDPVLRQRCFDENDLSVQKIVAILLARKAEKNKEPIQRKAPYKMKNVQKESSNALSKDNPSSKDNSASKDKQGTPAAAPKPCWRCKTVHSFKKCPAHGYRCDKCGEFDHYSHCCKNANQKNETKKLNTSKMNTKHPQHRSKSATDSYSNNLDVKPSAPDLSCFDQPLYPNLPPYMQFQQNNGAVARNFGNPQFNIPQK